MSPNKLSEVFQPQTVAIAAGCFWGVQYYLDQIPGVLETIVGYTGGTLKYPTYEQVCTDRTGHAEAVHVTYNPEKLSTETLLRHFFRLHDPTQFNRQGPDIGSQYRSAIFAPDPAQREIARQLKKELQEKSKKEIVTTINPGMPFYEAEPYHQKFTERTGRGMCHVPYKEIV